MVRGFGCSLACLVLSLYGTQASADGLPTARTEPTPRVRVRTYDQARVPAWVLSSGEEEASRILGRAGIATEWLECTRDGDRPECHERLAPGEIVLRILPGRATALLPATRDSFGFALVPQDGTPGVAVGVLYGAVESVARLGDAPVAQILGHVSAHEIGHLLLGPGAHGHDGIMRSGWSRQDLRQAAWGHLVFTEEESGRLRSTLIDRLAPRLQ